MVICDAAVPTLFTPVQSSILKNCRITLESEAYGNVNCLCECVISGFRHIVKDIFALLGRYAAYFGSKIPTFRDDLSVPCSRTVRPLQKGPTSCPDTSVDSYQSTLRNVPEGRRSTRENYILKLSVRFSCFVARRCSIGLE